MSDLRAASDAVAVDASAAPSEPEHMDGAAPSEPAKPARKPGKSSRGRLSGGYRAWLATHRSRDGYRFRGFLDAGEEIVGGPVDGSPLLRDEIWLRAVAALMHERAVKSWAEAVHLRDTGRGRRASRREVEKLAKRAGLAAITLREATARLEALAAARKPSTLAEELSRRQESGA